MASDPWKERLGETDLAWLEEEQLAGAGGRQQKAVFSISHFSFLIFHFGISERGRSRREGYYNEK
jgi:hypothetical protein